MWHLFKDSFTDGVRVTCNILAFVIPYVIYKVNQKLHKIGDPPWKGEEGEGEGEGEPID